MDFPGLPTPAPAPRIKICGLARPKDALLALELGADFLGMILTRKSPRYLDPGRAAALAQAIRATRPDARIVGVFSGESPAEIESAARSLGLFAVQVHGEALPPPNAIPCPILPAVAIRDTDAAARARDAQRAYGAVLADAYSPAREGGTGVLFDHALVAHLFAAPLFLAGGLKPANVAAVLRSFSGGPMPYALDLSSGVEESPGIKSHEAMRAFFAEAAAASR